MFLLIIVNSINDANNYVQFFNMITFHLKVIQDKKKKTKLLKIIIMLMLLFLIMNIVFLFILLNSHFSSLKLI